ncbi:hypothetical protein WMY93_021583 [Mugilogobius chulae]|uniref:Uncharacterized protein n=1 Tax=Mugilogobius chulae TaxID=88201 RepID=A0AAW0NB73_9GOBI
MAVPTEAHYQSSVGGRCTWLSCASDEIHPKLPAQMKENVQKNDGCGAADLLMWLTQRRTTVVTKCKCLKWPTIRREKELCVFDLRSDQKERLKRRRVFHTRGKEEKPRKKERVGNVFIRSKET